MDDPSDNSLIDSMWKDDVGLFLIVMILWDLIRAFFIAWLIPKFIKKK